MATVVDSFLRDQLLDRRNRLEQAAATAGHSHQVRNLIYEVDQALARMDGGSYGLCEVCREPIEAERLLSDPLCRFCLEHLTSGQQRALENDLELAARVQKSLLPKPHLHFRGWEVSYHYEPAGLVSGDYCDLITTENGDLHFILGDVSGKGVAASLLMVHLQAMFRTLIPMGLPLRELIGRASRVFCESTLPTHYATLVCGRASASGEVEICNAGHPPPLLLGTGEGLQVDPTGLPLGAFCDEEFATTQVRLDPGQTILLYTDGLTEARNAGGQMYGSDRLQEVALGQRGRTPRDIVDVYVKDLAAFRQNAPASDDLTIMAVHRSAAGADRMVS
jgi:sigma-B regulation protein RsbU (phosphoserine phosphatase)